MTVEEQPEEVLDELASDHLLLLAPRPDALEDEAKRRDHQQPEEITACIPDDLEHCASCACQAAAGQSQPNVPAVSVAYTSPSKTDLNIVIQFCLYQIERCGKAIA